MKRFLTDSPTRKKILLALKRNGTMSVEDLSREVSITPMGVRQHLLILEKSGAVEYVKKNQGVGRPGFLYQLTDAADDLFPKSYLSLSMDILADIERLDGKAKIEELFRGRKERFVLETKRMLSGEDTLSGRLYALADLLQKDGFIAELEEGNKYFRLSLFNCPISRISLRFREACANDFQAMKETIGEDVVREQCQADGDLACVFMVPKNNKSLSD